jgi:plasmid stabilization system protein ParE
MGYQVALSPSARRDLRDIVRYISVDSPQRAVILGQFLVSNTKRLADFPELGRCPNSVIPLSARLSFDHTASSTASITAIAAWTLPDSGMAHAELPMLETPKVDIDPCADETTVFPLHAATRSEIASGSRASDSNEE